MIKVGITGQAGFMGTHLFNFLGLKNDVERIPFEDEYFEDKDSLQNFVSNCDVIVHLAAMNRHEDQNIILDHTKSNARIILPFLIHWLSVHLWSMAGV